MNHKSNYTEGIPTTVFEKETTQANICCLVEEYAREDLASVSHIIAVSTEKDLLRELLKAKVAADEFGLVARNAVEYYDGDCFRTYYGDSFVCYQIIEQKNLTRKELLEQINGTKQKTSATFEQTIWTYPKTEEICIFMRECRDGDLDPKDMILFIAKCKKQAGLTTSDIQFIQNNRACQDALYNALCDFLDENDANMNWDIVRSFYSEERQETIACVLGKAYRQYRTNHPED